MAKRPPAQGQVHPAIVEIVRTLARAHALADYRRLNRPETQDDDSQSGDLREIQLGQAV